MADITVNAAIVLAQSGAKTEDGTSGEALTAGQSVYKNVTDQKWYKANAAGNAATAGAGGVAITLTTAPGAGQPVKLFKSGSIAIGGTVAVGMAYYVSDANAGGIMPQGDLSSNAYVTFIGHGTTSGIISTPVQAGAQVTGVQYP